MISVSFITRCFNLNYYMQRSLYEDFVQVELAYIRVLPENTLGSCLLSVGTDNEKMTHKMLIN